MQTRFCAGLDLNSVAGMKPRNQLGRSLKWQTYQMVDVELVSVFVEGAFNIELDLYDLTRGDVFEPRRNRVELDRPDRPYHAQTGVGRHSPIVSRLALSRQLDAVESASQQNHIVAPFCS